MAKKTEAPQAELTPREVSPYDVCIAYKVTFATQEGQIVMMDLLRNFGYNRNTTFDANHGVMATKEGQRSVLIHMGRQLDMDPITLEETRNSTGEM